MPESSSPNTTPPPEPTTETTNTNSIESNRLETHRIETNNIEIIIDAEGNVVLSDLPEALLPLLQALGQQNPLLTAPVCTLYPQSPESPDLQD